MRLGPYLIRAFALSAAGYAIWEWLAPLLERLLGGLTALILALSGRPFEMEAQATHRGPVLFLALYLAHRPPWREAIVYAPLGVAVCLLTQALTISAFAVFPTDRTVLERLMRSSAFALQNVTPILLWLFVSRREIFAAIESRVAHSAVEGSKAEDSKRDAERNQKTSPRSP